MQKTISKQQRQVDIYIGGVLSDSFQTNSTYCVGENYGLQLIRNKRFQMVNFKIKTISDESGISKLFCQSY